MNYNKMISITGLSGLFELVSSKSDGAIVRSLEDKSTKFVSSRVHNFSHLESIEVFTVKDNVNLTDVFVAMKESDEQLPDAKADVKVIKAYFEKVYPDMDFERVYNSDLKKMVKWYGMLSSNDVEIKSSQVHAQEEAPEAVTVEEEAPKKATEKAPKAVEEKAAKPVTAKAAKPAAEEPAKPAAENIAIEEAPAAPKKAPAKKAAAKKKAED